MMTLTRGVEGVDMVGGAGDPTVVFVLPTGLTLGGVEVWATQTATALAKHLPTAIVPYPIHPSLPVADFKSPPGVVVRPCGLPEWGGVSLRNYRIFRDLLPSIILPNNKGEAYVAAARLAQSRPGQVRVVGIYHGQCPIVLGNICHFEPITNRFIAVSEECAAEIRDRLPHRASDVAVRACGVEMPETLDRTYALPNEPIRLIWAGRVQEEAKRVSDLLPLAEVLYRKGVNFLFRIVGDGKDKPGLESRLAGMERGVQERVRLEPGVPHAQMRQILLDSDVAVMVSTTEGASVFLLEAMGHGCAPVVTEVSGTRTLIQPGVNGFRVPVGDLEGLANAILALDLDRRRLEVVGKAARETAAANSTTRYVEWMREYLAEVWREPGRRWPRTRPIFPWHVRATYPLIGRRMPWIQSALWSLRGDRHLGDGNRVA